MRRLSLGFLALAAVAVFAVTAGAKEANKPGNRGNGPPNGPPPFELGRVLPPHVKSDLKLTDDQEKQLADLEKEVKERLEKILTADQKKQLSTMRPPRRPGPGGQPPDGPPGEGGNPPPPPK